MKRYINAREVLPAELIKEIQKYVKGQHLYIPQTEREDWGASTGSKAAYQKRNTKILELYNSGVSIIELTEMYGLSEERVRNIIYEKQRDE
ncbi:CD3324 family protein [Alicyclobacillus fodiniaquatilis]|jgi:Mor family transcriptional regulator|uniref:CD3324 family protein n=1 Tax=Alicyclobacillus fodiniaquatilis TaxID=1661150 RepID=A0ABW4JPI0_9BACL